MTLLYDVETYIERLGENDDYLTPMTPLRTWALPLKKEIFFSALYAGVT